MRRIPTDGNPCAEIPPEKLGPRHPTIQGQAWAMSKGLNRKTNRPYTQKEIATVLGISRSSVSRIIRDFQELRSIIRPMDEERS